MSQSYSVRSSSATAQWSDTLSRVFDGLKSKSDDTRHIAAIKLRRYVSAQASDLTQELFGKFMTELIRAIHELVNSSVTVEKIGGIMAIEVRVCVRSLRSLALQEVIDIDYEENAAKISRLATYLRLGLSSNELVVMQMASKALGRLARASGTLTADYVEFEVKRALEWLSSERHEARRHAAVLVLKELAINAPTLFYVHVPAFVELIWGPLRDTKAAIREGAVEALRACLELIAERESRLRQQWYQKILEEARKSFRGSNSDHIHGSLLAIGELLRNAGDFMKSQFGEVCETVIKYKDASNKLVKKTIIVILPRLAEYNADVFVHSYLHTCMKHLLSRKDPDRGPAFVAIGEIAVAVQQSILPYLDSILSNVKAGLGAKGKHAALNEALACVGMVARAVGPEVAARGELLPHMFAAGLSPPLCSALAALARHAPALLPDIQERLLHVLSMVLAGRPFQHAGAATVGGSSGGAGGSGAGGGGGTPSTRPRKDKTGGAGGATTGGAPGDSELIRLALHTLGEFDFQGIVLTEFVRDSLVRYLDDDDTGIRVEAALTCAKLMAQTGGDDGQVPTRGHAAAVIGDVLEKLLVVGISDPDPTIRRAVLAALGPRFDHHLAQAESLRALFVALNDEVFEIRELAISVIGRLTQRNPAYVMPSLRKTLIQLLTELEFSGDSCNKEESAKLLGHLVRSARRLIQPYVGPMLRALLPKLRDKSSRVASCVLAALGELSVVGGDALRPHLDVLLPMIIGTLQDQSSTAKRQVALRTLGQRAESTGFVIEPFMRYPHLLDILLTLIKTETQPAIRLEVLRVLGILGALDPYKHKQSTQLVTAPRYDDSDEPNDANNGGNNNNNNNNNNNAVAGTVATNAAIAANNNNNNVNAGNANGIGNNNNNNDKTAPVVPVDEVPPGMTPSSDEYYPVVAVNALMRILRDPSLSSHHSVVIQAVMFIFKSLGLKCVPYLPQIMPQFLHVMRTCEPLFREFLFQQLGMLVAIVKQHIRVYLDAIFALVHEHWHTPLLQQIIALVEEISLALNDEFKIFLPELIPQLLNVLHQDRTPHRLPTQKVLAALEVFGTSLDDYLHLVIPAVVRLLEQVDIPPEARRTAIRTLGRLCRKLHIADYASRIIHPLSRVLADPSLADFHECVMETLCALVHQLGPDYAIFIAMIGKVLQKQRIQHARYDGLVAKVMKLQPLAADGAPMAGGGSGDSAVGLGMRLGARGNMALTNGNGVLEALASDDVSSADVADAGDAPNEGSSGKQSDAPAPDPANALKKLRVNEENLKKAWEASQRSTKEDWYEWTRRLSIELLRESPSPALRSCLSLAQDYHPLVRELFNAAFVSCWNELPEQYQDELVHSIETALMSPNIPPELLHQLLDLAEFMEHDDKPLPIDIRTLGSLAEKCHAYAKALHYKEIEFEDSPANTIEALISIYNELQQPDAAVGILKHAQQHHSVELKESWYEKLGRWDDALEAYESKQADNAGSMALTLGRMRSLHALGEWSKLERLAHEKWNVADASTRRRIAPLSAAAAWNLHMWDRLEEYIGAMTENSVDGAFFRAISAVHRDAYDEARRYVDRSRHLLDTKLTALVGESYNRAYNVMVRVQQLSELEEVIEYKCTPDTTRRGTIRRIWDARLMGCQRDVDTWQQLLAVRSMVVAPQEDMDIWLKFAGLCRKSGRLRLSHKTLTKLMGNDPATLLERAGSDAPTPFPRVTFAYIKQLWAAGHRQTAFERLRVFGTTVGSVDATLQGPVFLKLGEWQLAQLDGFDKESIPRIISNFRAAVRYDPNWYKAWHKWALINFDVIAHHEQRGAPEKVLGPFLVPAVAGFFRSIALAPQQSLQDTLRLLTLWFKHGARPAVESALQEGFGTVSIDTWLQVIPQIIARIASPVAPVRRLIHELLCDIGKEHPQALVYPLTVASKSHSRSRQQAAKAILEQMRTHSATLVDQALLVSQELIRVSILWHEMWHEGLEDASRLYFGDHNVDGMLATLEPLHAMLDKGPETMREISFQQAYGRDLREAAEWCQKHRRTGKANDLNQAWDLYYQVFRRINKQLPQMTTMELQYVSPKLLRARDLELAVPGTYYAGQPLVRIARFAPSLSVINSKQRPRKLSIGGADGTDYAFLLKGHEDLRQDERVMQLFGLVNTLLTNDRETAKSHLAIQRYAVVPLSPNSGLLSWVSDHDTMHGLIREYRDSRKVLLNIEHRLMLQMSSDYDHLCLMQKVEVFEHALGSTNGQDLAKVLWLKSRNSEVWLDRRTNYTRSLAVMSMVGYILGLGDRHPSNLMLSRHTGKILHIDFGDCFEVAMHRDKYPEQIPFRLTRMLVNAMEVSGIEGTFRSTCENVMRVLRDNKESLMAVLEAFVYDPLINWRLLAPAAPVSPSATSAQASRDLSDDLVDRSPSTSSSALSRSAEARASTAAANAAANADAATAMALAAASADADTYGDEAPGAMPEVLNERALSVISRVSKKLTGRDFSVDALHLPNASSAPNDANSNGSGLGGGAANNSEPLDVPEQVQRLIVQATSHENLCQCYIGWCPFW